MSTYQVKLSPGGRWHRRQVYAPGHDPNGHTVCGIAIQGAYLSREWALDDQLCPECFTKREMDTGEMKKIEKHALEHARADDLVDEWRGDDETTDEIDPAPVTIKKEGD